MEMQDFSFRKSLGQNFIRDASIVDKICRVSEVDKDCFVIEIGPGAGSLTSKLVERAGHVLAYEIDTRLEEYLKDKFKSATNIDFIFDDFMKRDIAQDLKNYSFDKLYVVANLPYYITTPILEKLIAEVDAEKLVLMVQKEVADRFSAKPGTKEYNSLTIFLNVHYRTKLEFVVNRNCFVPKPHVDSAVVSFKKLEKPYEILHRASFFQLVRDSFQFKRKTLRNNLKGYPLEKIEKVLIEYGHDLSVRAENISVEEFIAISNDLEK